MTKPTPINNNPKPVQNNPPPPPPKGSGAPKKVDNSRFEGAVSQARGHATTPIKVNINHPAPPPPVNQPTGTGTKLNKIL